MLDGLRRICAASWRMRMGSCVSRRPRPVRRRWTICSRPRWDCKGRLVGRQVQRVELALDELGQPASAA